MDFLDPLNHKMQSTCQQKAECGNSWNSSKHCYIDNRWRDIYCKVCKLVRGTGYHFNTKTKVDVMYLIPKNYPCDYFSRFSVDRVLTENLINAIKDDDIYSQLPAYPNPEHRSVNIWPQSSLLCYASCLRFQYQEMREIVDKHFPDNWVIPMYQGHLVDLTVYWGENFPAAMKALSNNIQFHLIEEYALDHTKELMNKCIYEIAEYFSGNRNGYEN